MSDRTLDFPSGLVDGARQGDGRALRALTVRAYPVVHRWALVHTGDPMEADDLTQDVLVQMIRKMESSTTGAISVRETSDNLDKIARVLAEFDKVRADVPLHFQLIEADGFTETDPRISAVEVEL